MRDRGSAEVSFSENDLKYEEYCALRESVGWDLFSEKQTKEALSRSLFTVTARLNGQPVGMVRVVGDGLYCSIVDVVVRPEFSHRGIGTELVRRVIERLEEELQTGGRTSIFLTAEKGKESFYENLGFKRIPHEYCGCGMRRVIRRA